MPHPQRYHSSAILRSLSITVGVGGASPCSCGILTGRPQVWHHVVIASRLVGSGISTPPQRSVRRWWSSSYLHLRQAKQRRSPPRFFSLHHRQIHGLAISSAAVVVIDMAAVNPPGCRARVGN